MICLFSLTRRFDRYIYDANKKLLKDPSKIYPGQKLMIPRDGFKMEDIRKARKKAGARKP